MKLLFAVPLAAVTALWLSSAALAGGFAVTTLDPLPDAFHAGQTYRIGYLIRQHGVSPFTQAQPRIRISKGHGEQLSFAGFPEGAPGHYVSEVNFPSDGPWTWLVDQNPFPIPQELGAISVLPTAPTAPAPKSQPPVELAMAALVALLFGAGALALVQLNRVNSLRVPRRPVDIVEYATPEIREPGRC
jgi:hypothetical protein